VFEIIGLVYSMPYFLFIAEDGSQCQGDLATVPTCNFGEFRNSYYLHLPLSLMLQYFVL